MSLIQQHILPIQMSNYHPNQALLTWNFSPNFYNFRHLVSTNVALIRTSSLEVSSTMFDGLLGGV